MARTEGYLEHLNQYYVINLDITGFISEANRRRISMTDVPNEIVKAVHKELKNMVPELVAGAVEDIRSTQYAPTFYSDEQALRYVIKFAYIAAVDQYLKIEELPSGKGIADVVYLPKPKPMLPALVIELKWNTSSERAIRQIKERNYPVVLKDYGGEVVIVGISYDEKKKRHCCKIERI